MEKKYGDIPDHPLWHALELLELSGLSRKEIAAESGFQNQYYFSNVVKKAYGCEPGELWVRLRKSHENFNLLSHGISVACENACISGNV